MALYGNIWPFFLISALLFSGGGLRDEQCTEAFCFMIAKDDMPLRTSERQGMRVFAKALQPLWKMPSEPTTTNRLEMKYEELREKFGKKIAAVESLTLTVDLWTHSETMTGYLGMTA